MKEKYEVYKNKILQYFKKSAQRDSSLRVTRDWRYVLGVTVTVIVILCGVGVYEFFFAKYHTDEDGQESVFVNTTFEKADYEGVLQKYKERDITFVKVKENKPSVPDLGIVKSAPAVEYEEGETPRVE